jgi:uridine kinase
MMSPRRPSPRGGPRPTARVVPGRPRTRVQARFSDGRLFDAPPGAELAEILRAACPHDGAAVVAAIVNGRLRELTTPLATDSEVAPVTLDDPDGVRIYRRSLVFLLVAAAAEVFPDAEVFIEHSATTAAGYFCEVRNRPPFTQAELQAIEARMREIVAEDAPICKETAPVQEAMEFFAARGETDKARLFAHRRKGTIALYGLRGRRDYFQGYMAPSTGCLSHFALRAFPPGFMLRFPHHGQPHTLTPAAPYPKLFALFEEAGHWLDRLGIRGVGALNDAIAEGRLPEISLVAEALHEARIAEIANQVASKERARVVLVAGPSSSGKTTFAKRLAVQLLALGRRSFALGLDDYFVDRDATPHDASGKPDYETLAALDLSLFNDHLLALTDGRTVSLPRYNFLTGQREAGPTVGLGADDIVIVEGIHGLNPELVPGISADRLYRIYVSALTQLNLDRHNRVSTVDSRLVRRVVRDAAQRGYSAADTLSRWDAVSRGEKQHIFPYQENADAIFNSALVHELAILRPLAEPLLLQIRPENPAFIEANRILSFLQWFEPAPPRHVPDNSILREFIGGSILEGFRLWPKMS